MQPPYARRHAHDCCTNTTNLGGIVSVKNHDAVFKRNLGECQGFFPTPSNLSIMPLSCSLSAGEQQLAIFARALVSEADILILYEPTSALGLKNQMVVLDWMRMD